MLAERPSHLTRHTRKYLFLLCDRLFVELTARLNDGIRLEMDRSGISVDPNQNYGQCCLSNRQVYIPVMGYK